MMLEIGTHIYYDNSSRKLQRGEILNITSDKKRCLILIYESKTVSGMPLQTWVSVDDIIIDYQFYRDQKLDELLMTKNLTIVGGGVSGTLLTINIIKNWKGGDLNINLIELNRDRFNTGIAYSTNEISHLLNVRVSGMSIFSEEPDHFYNWLIKSGYNYTKSDFVPRMIFGKYVQYYYNQYVENKPINIKVNTIFDEVTNITKSNDSYNVVLSQGKPFLSNRDFNTDMVVLAFGHLSISEIDSLKYKDIKNYLRTPWLNNIYDRIGKNDNVFLIGSGLTTDDIILSLKQREHKGKIWSISRKGHQPLNHKIYQPYPNFYNELEGKDINQMFSIIKRHIKSHTEPRAVIDSLRPNIQQIWKSLSKTDKSRFLRHINPIWNVIRHRMPESTYETLQLMQQSGQLEFIKGDIKSIQESNGSLKIDIYDKSKKSNQQLDANFVINCIGPESNYKRINQELIKNLLDSGLITCSDNLICIRTNGWNIVDTSGEEMTNLMAIGPVLKGELFESTAVPEIKVQAEELSKNILKCLKLETV